MSQLFAWGGQVYAPISNAEEAEVERFYEDLQDLLELTPPRPHKKKEKKNVLFPVKTFFFHPK